jgi:hypothetical protein
VEDVCAIRELYASHVSSVLDERAKLQAQLGHSDNLVAEMVGRLGAPSVVARPFT